MLKKLYKKRHILHKIILILNLIIFDFLLVTPENKILNVLYLITYFYSLNYIYFSNNRFKEGKQWKNYK